MAGATENLKNQLALAIRSIQWSYAIFWSVSATPPGVLEWVDGYYNGDIKTRKTIQAAELKADQLGLQRSEQLRELYESLSAGEASGGSQTARRSSAALSPEDLTDTEWYYLVCMSFVFDIGEGMAGRCLAVGEVIWLCNAHNADSKVFSRSLLAKSASIQTVVCFPFSGGVIEIGTTEVVSEDLSLIHYIKTSFLEAPCMGLPHNLDDIPDHHLCPPRLQSSDVNMASSEKNSDDFDAEQEQEDSFMIEELNGGASQVQSWQFMDEEFSNCIHNSLNSSDCISQTFVEPPRNKNRNNAGWVGRTSPRVLDIQERNRTKLTSLDLRSNDLHYQGVLSVLFKTTNQLILGGNAQNSGNRRTSFVAWKKPLMIQELRNVTSQKMLKKVLFEIPKMYENEPLGSPEEPGLGDEELRREGDEATNHVLSERRGREKLNERLMILRSIVPSITKVDKVSILDDTIEYLQELERRVEELESCRESADGEPRLRKNPQDASSERTSTCGERRRAAASKRKACHIDEGGGGEPESAEFVVCKGGPAENLTVRSFGQDVVIEISCLWREGILLEIMDTVSGLNLDSHSVQSATGEGILSLTVNCKHKGSKVATTGMIRQALQRVAWKR